MHVEFSFSSLFFFENPFYFINSFLVSKKRSNSKRIQNESPEEGGHLLTLSDLLSSNSLSPLLVSSSVPVVILVPASIPREDFTVSLGIGISTSPCPVTIHSTWDLALSPYNNFHSFIPSHRSTERAVSPESIEGSKCRTTHDLLDILVS